jgi:hypothetical protein
MVFFVKGFGVVKGLWRDSVVNPSWTGAAALVPLRLVLFRVFAR